MKTVFNALIIIGLLLLDTCLLAQTNNDKVFFELNSAEIKPAEQQKLKRLIDDKTINNEKKVLLYGYTDYLGSKEYNNNLSTLRAKNVKNYLIHNGIHEQNIPITIGKGTATKPADSNETAEEPETGAYIPNAAGKRKINNKSADIAEDRGNPEDRRVDIVMDAAMISKYLCKSLPPVQRFEVQTELDKYRKALPKDEQYYPKVRLSDNATLTTLDNGDTYKGTLNNNGQKDGLGIYKYANDEEYVGYFANDKINGDGTYMWPNGDYVQGQWVDGELRKGQVVVYTKHGQIEGPEYFEGEFKNGKRNGHGRYTYPDGKSFEAEYKDDKIKKGEIVFDDNDSYSGELKNNQINGMGTYRYANGDTYTGNWVDGQREGHGIITRPNGDKYDGEWKNNQKTGHGTMTRKNGDSYEGEWENNLRQGHGTAKYGIGGSYIGEWKNGKYEGHGKRIFENGDIQEGIYTNGELNGKGSYYYADDSSTYIGNYINGLADGEGVLTQIDGIKYTGHFKNDQRNGTGILSTPSGIEIYNGEWKDDVRNGKGKWKYPNGDYYDGDWNMDYREGQGVYVARNGDRFEGGWLHNLRNGKGKNSYINGATSEGTYVNDKKDGNWVFIDKDGKREDQVWKDGIKISPTDNATARANDIAILPEDSHAPANKPGHDTIRIATETTITETQTTINYPNGDTYFGTIVNNKRNGYGRYTYANGDVYVGEWKDDQPNGHGKYSFHYGASYEGNYVNGKKDGKGVFIDENNQRFDQEWDRGTIINNGNNPTAFVPVETPGIVNNNKIDTNIDVYNRTTQTYGTGDKYIGGMVGNIRQGYGIYTTADSDVFEGQWSDNVRNGPGKYTYKNTSYYIGNYTNGQKDGPGYFVDEHGKVEKQEWKNGVLITTTTKTTSTLKNKYKTEKDIRNEVVINHLTFKQVVWKKDSGDYITLKSGAQWMTKNLDVATYKNGSEIRHAITRADWTNCEKKQEGCWCYYNNDSTNGYGKLYNYFAVKDKRGLAPEDWNIPTKSQYESLLRYFADGKVERGYRLKASEGWANGGNGNNESGFSAQATGFRDGEYGAFIDNGHYANWWTRNERGRNRAYNLQISNLNKEATCAQIQKNYKNGGYSVRCIRHGAAPTITTTITNKTDTTTNTTNTINITK